jgi:imidazole glycerol phosphate synthase subunit HisF
LADAIQIGRADAALAASIFHYGQYTIEETKKVMAARGIPVRGVAVGDGRKTEERVNGSG